MEAYLDEIETERLLTQHQLENDASEDSELIFFEMKDSLKLLLSKDLKKCVIWAFSRLDKNQNGYIRTDLLIKALVMLLKTHSSNKAIKESITSILTTVR